VNEQLNERLKDLRLKAIENLTIRRIECLIV